MKPSPYSPQSLVLFVFVLGLLLALIHIGILRIVFEKLGLSETAAFIMLFASLLGSTINIPLFTIDAKEPFHEPVKLPKMGLLRWPKVQFENKTLVAVNIGGCVIPLAFSLYLLLMHQLPMFKVALVVLIVSGLSWGFSRPIRGIGIAMPIFVAPVSSALLALTLDPAHSAPLAYIGGTMGVLIGADLFRLNDIRYLGSPFASIGGAGTFDGIFLSGVVAVLLA
ncbi:MAG: DUF1614 domain-containing protein [Proteobacteria bacterium]|nr:DUF1614 domain-containing protein [Pseudomonadota bacterium]